MPVNTPTLEYIQELVVHQKSFFLQQHTKPIGWRLNKLQQLKKALLQHETAIYEALYLDLHKSEKEAFLTEFGIVMNELDNHLRNLKKWSRPVKVRTPLSLFPSKSRIIREPLGVALIIAPWNYPLNLMICPLIGAISAGNCAILKPSPYAAHVAKVMEQIIGTTFDKSHIALVQGHRDVNTLLLQQHFDMIFYTGSPAVGRVVMEAAAYHLAPIVLELGGKSPCIVDKGANLDLAARRIAWGKTLNAGQTCVAPDHLFVHESLKKPLVEKIIENFVAFYGEDARNSENYCRIISDKAFARLTGYLKDGKLLYGGQTDAEQRYIQPTLIEVEPEMPIMQDEVFGPILPVMTYNSLNDVIGYLNRHPKPLAFYYFGNAEKGMGMLAKTTSGGACINDTVLHIGNSRLPFGGVGNSGMGHYHGKESYLAFSHSRSVLLSSNRYDVALKYPPYKKFNLLRKLF
ncbi:MAG: aldehyde dehydrogenase [Candidatus Limimorpha sp.]